MCRGYIIKPGATRAAQIGAPRTAECQKLKNGLCPEQSCISTIQSLLAQDESVNCPPVFLQSKQPIKRPAFLSKLDQTKPCAVQPPVVAKGANTPPKTQRAEAEYILEDKDAIPVVRIDTFERSCLDRVQQGELAVPEETPAVNKEPWQVVLDGFGNECELDNLLYSPNCAKPTQNEKVPDSVAGQSLIAQLLSTEDSVREVYKKIEEEELERPRLSSVATAPSPYMYDSGYDDSPTATVFDPSESSSPVDQMETDFQEMFHQFSPPKAPLQPVPRKGLDFFYPSHNSGAQELPPAVQTGACSPVPQYHADTPPNVSPFYDCNWTPSLPSSPHYGEKQLLTDLEFEPRAPLWEQQVFSSSPIFPPALERQEGSFLDMESELMFAESFFDPSMDLKNVAF